jgi:hypothetical protein
MGTSSYRPEQVIDLILASRPLLGAVARQEHNKPLWDCRSRRRPNQLDGCGDPNIFDGLVFCDEAEEAVRFIGNAGGEIDAVTQGKQRP